MMKVLIGVPAWNEEATIYGTLDSLMALDYPKNQYRVVVVNDASADRTAEVVELYPVDLINAPKNQGSKSRALGLIPLESYDADIFICVDADTILRKDAVTEIVKAFEDPSVTIASGHVMSRFSNGMKKANIWTAARSAEYATGQKIVKETQSKYKTVLVACGCFFAIRMEYLKNHKFSERTIAEDMDLTWTAMEDGHYIAYVPTAICEVNDPWNFHTYWNQLSRWYRGFFQNIKVRNGNIFKNKKLGFLVYLYMFANLTGQPLFWYMVYMHPTFALSTTLMTFFIMWLYYEPIRHPILSMKGVIEMFLLTFLNYIIYVDSIYKELIRNNKLKVWVKGH